jgi:hypothetical protein
MFYVHNRFCKNLASINRKSFLKACLNADLHTVDIRIEEDRTFVHKN